MATIYLFRHGQSDFNLEKRFTGHLNSRLTALGQQQAEILGEQLKDKAISIAYTSSLSRARDTLKIVLRHHSDCREIIVDDRIIERSYGDLSGKTHQQVIANFGQDQFDLWHRGWSIRPPAGESLADVEVRVGEFINDLKAKYAGSSDQIAISAHGNSIRVFRKIMENSTIEETCSWTIPYDRYFEYVI